MLFARDGKVAKAQPLIEAALELTPQDPQLLFHAARILEEVDRARDAAAHYERALQLQPRDARTRYHRALNLLSLGMVSEGAPLYAARPTATHPNSAVRRLPRWSGAPSGGQVLLWAEQGVGDEIMFLRFLSVVPEWHESLVVEMDRRLRPLFERNFPNVTFVDRGSPVQAKRFVAQAAAGDLLCLFHPRMRYAEFRRHTLAARGAGDVRRLPERSAIGHRKIIGLSWLTMSTEQGLSRSVAIEQLLDALDPRRHAVVNLQYLAPEQDLAHIRQRGFELLDPGALDCYQDLQGLAAVICELDHVVCIDNSTAHLAGTLGQDTLLLLPKACNWRWQDGDRDTVWYPRVRPLRQQEAGSWQEPIVRLRALLLGH